jgi:glucose uptake protein GlcU
MIIAGIGMISAFLWGSLIFREKVSDLPMAIFANIFLVIGVYCVSTSQAKESVSQDGTYKYIFFRRFGYICVLVCKFIFMS